MPLCRYRINQETISLILEDGRHVACMVPSGAIIRLDSALLEGDRLVDVIWKRQTVMMFSRDLLSRARLLDPAE